MKTVKDIEVRFYKPLLDGYTILSKDGGPNIGFFCSLRALKDYARQCNFIARKGNWAHIALGHQEILGKTLAEKMGQAFARMDKRSRGEVA